MNPTDNPVAQHSARDYPPAWLTLALGFVVSGLVAAWFWREAEQLDRTRFQMTVTNLIEQLDASTARYGEELQRFADLLATQLEVSETTWQERTSQPAPPGNLPAFVELAYVTDPDPLSRSEVEVLLKSHATSSGRGHLPQRGVASLKLQHHWRNASTVAAEETEQWLQEWLRNGAWWAVIEGRLLSAPRRLVPGIRWKAAGGHQPLCTRLCRRLAATYRPLYRTLSQLPPLGPNRYCRIIR